MRIAAPMESEKQPKWCGRERATLLLRNFIGIGVPTIFLPFVFQEDVTRAFIQCAIAMTIMFVTRLIPVQMTAMLPLMFLSSDVVRPDSISPYYFSLPVLHVMAAMMMVTSMESTSLYPRCANLLLMRVGTRARPLIFSMAGLSFMAAFFFESLVGMLIMFALCHSVIAVLKIDEVQRIHRRVLFDSATESMPARLRKNLEDYILCEECELPSELPCDEMPCEMPCEMPDEMPDEIPDEMPCDMSLVMPRETASTAAPNAAHSRAPCLMHSEIRSEPHSRYHAEIQREVVVDEPPMSQEGEEQGATHDVPNGRTREDAAPPSEALKKESAGSRGSLDRKTYDSEVLLRSMTDTIEQHSKLRRKDTHRTISFGESRGVQSPMLTSKLTTSTRRRPPAQHCPEFLETLVMENDVLMNIVNWHSSRYLTIQGHMMYSVMLLNVIASMLIISGSPSNTYFLEYAAETFHGTEIHQGKWLLLVLPVALSAAAVAVRCLDRQFLANFDPKQSPKAASAIRGIIADNEEIIGKIRRAEIAPLVCFVLWLARMTNIVEHLSLLYLITKGDPSSLITVDYGLVVMLFLLPASVNDVNEETARKLINKLPWGAVILVGGIFTMRAAWNQVKQRGTVEEYVRKQLQGTTPFTAQLVLIFTSCVMTEFISNVGTVSFLLPIATDLARDIPCHPMYLGFPVAVAASTTLILPTSSVALAILYNSTTVGPSKTMLPGLAIKVTAAVAILLSTNTIGLYVLQWNYSMQWDVAPNRSHLGAA